MKRRTTQRAAIEQVLRQADGPLGVEEILGAGRAMVGSLNQATVYRNLTRLVEAGWLRKVSLPALGTLYERTGKGHHHHFHCRVCGRVFELPGCPLDQGKTPAGGFVTEDHEVFLFGVCPSCAA